MNTSSKTLLPTLNRPLRPAICMIFIALFLSCSDDEESPKTVIGTWRTSVVVPPNPMVFSNVITFSGEETQGTFVDRTNHTGTWTLKGDSITWNIENVPNLTNTFTGKIDENFKTMTGKNFGFENGDPFAGTWSATKQ